MADIKPRTIPEALGLTERKCVAIAESVKESLNERSTIDALIEIKSMFNDDNERVFAIYAYSIALGFKKAENRFREAVPQIAQEGMKAGVGMTLARLQEMEQAGMIKIIDLDPENKKVPKPDESSLPDDLLYGTDGRNNNINSEGSSIFGNGDENPTTSKKPKTDEDERMYG